jgi:DNA-directed RNA polymerase sigma subunit (sigma70/sigma32)
MPTDPSAYLDSGSLSEFVRDASSAPIPDPDEELRLAMAASRGDGRARDVLIQTHLRTVVDVAIVLRGDVPASRLIAAGVRGLVQAADRFDPGHDGSFTTFARPFIRREMRAALFPELAQEG